MGINGIHEIVIPLPPEAQAYYRQQRAAEQLRIFGADRLAADEGNPASPEDVTALTWQIEELCAGNSSRALVNDSNPGNPVQIHWNPARITGGFGANSEWDGAMASIGPVNLGQVWSRHPGNRLPHPYQVTEGLYIDPGSGRANIRRTLRSYLGDEPTHSSTKAANAGEVAAWANRLAPYAEQQSTQATSAVFLEIGYGLDPMALRGKRTFTNKICVGLDSAIGSYENRFGAYPDAVRTQSSNYAAQAARKGEHIAYVIGDGQALPFAANSIREIFMSNVLNAPIDPETRLAIVGEARRVIEDIGSLVIRINWHQDQWPHDRIVQFLRHNGFNVVRTLDSSETAYDSMNKQYGLPTEVAAPDGYYAIATPE